MRTMIITHQTMKIKKSKRREKRKMAAAQSNAAKASKEDLKLLAEQQKN